MTKARYYEADRFGCRIKWVHIPPTSRDEDPSGSDTILEAEIVDKNELFDSLYDFGEEIEA